MCNHFYIVNDARDISDKFNSKKQNSFSTQYTTVCLLCLIQ